jgi:hypothetical protein
MNGKNVLYADLVDMSSPLRVLEEVLHLTRLISGSDDTGLVSSVFQDVCELYEGGYPGYRRCNTYYHDLRHSTDVLLALVRLLHGAAEAGERFSPELVKLALLSAIMHDTGYIQKSVEVEGTGGKFTLTHVDRSIDFMLEYLPTKGFSNDEIDICCSLVKCTSISIPLDQIQFSSARVALLGMMVGTADFLGQIADRIYLEKLLFLYREFKEAGVNGYNSELDLLKKTIEFYGFIQKRLRITLGNVQRYMKPHFLARWHINRDLYQDAVNNNLAYLDFLINQDEGNYRLNLKREGIIDRLVALEAIEEMHLNLIQLEA